MSNKLILEAILNPHSDISEKRRKEIAEKLELPQNNQRDLMFMSAILVSTGVNKNGAGFLGSELILARETISQKPLNISHDSKQVIGHITNWIFMDQDGNVLDDKALYEAATHHDEDERKKAIAELDAMEMDIGIICAVYKANFPEIAEEISMGKWKVSMECYYDDFDIKVDDTIIAKDEAIEKSWSDARVNKVIRDIVAGRALGNERIARMLRGIRFCGVGIVENPANDRSLILEAASKVSRKKRTVLAEAAEMSLESVDLRNLKEPEEDKKVVEKSEVGFILLIDSTVQERYVDFDEAKENAIKLATEGKPVRLASLNNYFIEMSAVAESELSDIVVHSEEDSYEVVGSSKVAFIVDGTEEGTDTLEEEAEEMNKVLEAGPDKVSPKVIENIEKHKDIKDLSNEEAEEEKEFPVSKAVEKVEKLKVPRVKPTSTDERKKLSHACFALRQARKYPIHTRDRIQANMKLFKYIRKELAEKDSKEFFNNLVIAGLKLGIETEEFERNTEGLEFAAGKDYSSEYGLPRLELFPLDTREQVISAMSKFSRLKVKMSSHEREMLVVNILKAAAKFGINTNAFKKRALKSKAVKKNSLNRDND
jgi:hypothetical protein